MQRKAKQKIKHIKMLQQIFTRTTYVPPQVFFLPPIGRWLLYRQTHKHKGFAVYNDKQPQVQNVKWRHLYFIFLRGGCLFQSTLTLHSAKLFSIIFLDNVSTPIVPQHCVWIEPLLGGLFRRSQVSCTLYGGHFKLIYLIIFHSETILKGSFSLWGRWD